jgi:hypothetical protein
MFEGYALHVFQTEVGRSLKLSSDVSLDQSSLCFRVEWKLSFNPGLVPVLAANLVFVGRVDLICFGFGSVRLQRFVFLHRIAASPISLLTGLGFVACQ